MNKLKIKITSAEKDFWYVDKIGHEFEVYESLEGSFAHETNSFKVCGDHDFGLKDIFNEEGRLKLSLQGVGFPFSLLERDLYNKGRVFPNLYIKKSDCEVIGVKPFTMKKYIVSMNVEGVPDIEVFGRLVLISQKSGRRLQVQFECGDCEDYDKGTMVFHNVCYVKEID